jgi:hypothetical protein
LKFRGDQLPGEAPLERRCALVVKSPPSKDRVQTILSLINIERDRDEHSIFIIEFGFANALTETPVCATDKAKTTHPTVVHFFDEAKMKMQR